MSDMTLAAALRRFRTDSPKRLLDKASSLGTEILPLADATTALSTVNKHGSGIKPSDRWDAWRDLVGIHRQCKRQLRLLVEADHLLQRAINHESLSSATQKDLLSCFDGKSPRNTDFREAALHLQQQFDIRTRYWQLLRRRLRRTAPDVFVTHAFLMVAEISGVEMASLGVGALAASGALYTLAFYDAAIERSVLEYFTLEDVFDQAIRRLAQIAVALSLVEATFFIARKSWQFFAPARLYTPHWLVLRHSVMMVFFTLILTACVSFFWGSFRGKHVRDDFFGMTADKAQLATVLDGTVLRDVYLVGTTSRTATFLQVEEWGERRSLRKRGLRSRCEKRLLNPEPIADKCVLRERVLVMDRALVVCHAEGDACLEQDRNPIARPMASEQVDLEEALSEIASRDDVEEISREVARQIRGGQEEMRRQLDVYQDGTENHLDRHHEQVLEEIGKFRPPR